MEIEEYTITHNLEDWFVMLNTDEFDSTDAGIVRDEIKEVLLKRYGKRLGTSFQLNKSNTHRKEKEKR